MMSTPFSKRALKKNLSPRQSPQLLLPRFASATILLAALLTLGLSGPALALKADRTAPMDLKAETWTGSMLEGKQVWKGNVRIAQGSLKIEADIGTISYQDGQVGMAVLEGNPAVVSQAREGGGSVRAQARKIDYDLAANKVILSGAVKIEENGNTTTGERFEYALDSGAIAGDGGSGQVTMRLVPKAVESAQPQDSQ